MAGEPPPPNGTHKVCFLFTYHTGHAQRVIFFILLICAAQRVLRGLLGRLAVLLPDCASASVGAGHGGQAQAVSRGGGAHSADRCLPLVSRPTVHGLLQDFQLIVELRDDGALAEWAWDEPSLQLVGDVLSGSQLLVVLSWLGQQLQNWGALALQGDGAQGVVSRLA